MIRSRSILFIFQFKEQVFLSNIKYILSKLTILEASRPRMKNI